MRKIAVYDNFTEPKHRQQIDGTAARYGFTVDYYPAPQSAHRIPSAAADRMPPA